MKVKSIMTRDVATCGMEDKLSTAAALMWQRDCGIVLVVDDSGRLEGVVTDRDLCMSSLLNNRPLSALKVTDAMSKGTFSVSEEETVRDVHLLMRDKEIRRVPVVDRDQLPVGVITLADLATEAYHGRSAAARKRQRDVGKTFATISEPRELLEEEETGEVSAAEA